MSTGTTLVLGTVARLVAALALSSCSTHVNPSFLERLNGTKP